MTTMFNSSKPSWNTVSFAPSGLYGLGHVSFAGLFLAGGYLIFITIPVLLSLLLVFCNFCKFYLLSQWWHYFWWNSLKVNPATWHTWRWTKLWSDGKRSGVSYKIVVQTSPEKTEVTQYIKTKELTDSNNNDIQMTRPFKQMSIFIFFWSSSELSL